MSGPTHGYGRHLIEADDIDAVVDVLRGDWLTTGPAVETFERAFADYVGARHAVVCNSGTAALYLAARAFDFQAGDAVLVPAITFVATASANAMCGATPLFADVDPDTGLMQPEHADAALRRADGRRVRAVFPVHLGGQVAVPGDLKSWADAHGIAVVEDACHALGTTYDGGRFRVGDCGHSLAACFSFHPVKTIAMGEGGALTTNSDSLAARARRLRAHGIARDPAGFQNRELAFDADGSVNPWYYETLEPSHNLRASDLNCALGSSQLRKVGRFVERRRALVARYRARLAHGQVKGVLPVPGTPDCAPGWHLFVILADFAALGITRRELMERLRRRGVGSQVHYIPVHLQPAFLAGAAPLDLPGARAYYERTLSLPLHAGMSEADVDHVVDALAEAVQA